MQIDKTEIENMINMKITTAEKKYGFEFKSTLIEILSIEKMLAPKTGIEEKKRLNRKSISYNRRKKQTNPTDKME